jgi:hypothetical protein
VKGLEVLGVLEVPWVLKVLVLKVLAVLEVLCRRAGIRGRASR